MVTDPFRVCPQCLRLQQVRFKGYNEQDVLVFLDHYDGESEGHHKLCEGSGKVFVGTTETKPTTVSDTGTKSAPTPQLSQPTVVQRRTAQCPECGQTVPAKLNLRKNLIYAPHSSRRTECPGSYRRVRT